MKVEGYKVNEYDATFHKALFNVIERRNRVLEITDVESGEMFLLDFKTAERTKKDNIRAWREGGISQEKHGTYIAFGSGGFFEELKYGGRKPKQKL